MIKPQDKMIYFVTGLPHSGTSIIQKTISDQKGYTIKIKKNGNTCESSDFRSELNKYHTLQELNGNVSKAAKIKGIPKSDFINSVVCKLPCEPLYLQNIFHKVENSLDISNLCLVFTKRDPIQWCSSYLSRNMHPNDLAKDINLEWNKTKPDFKTKEWPTPRKTLNSKKAFIIYLKKLYDYYCERVDGVINSERKAKVVFIDLLNFSHNPEKFLKTIGFDNPAIKGKPNNFKNGISSSEHETKRAAQIKYKPDPNVIKKDYDFHPTIKDFMQKTFRE